MIRWGILGAGKIAVRFAESLKHDPNSVLTAISVRKEEKALKFKEQFEFERYYMSHDELIQDKEIDAIYCSLPHGLHKEWTIKALKNHKAVLCEKPATLSYEEMEEIAEVAKETGCLFMEAMKTRFVPLYADIKEMIQKGKLGKIKRIETHFCSLASSDILANSYLGDPAQGGVLLDTGCYGVSWIEEFVREPMTLKKIYANNKAGVNDYVDAYLESESGIQIELEAALDRKKPKTAIILGEKGSLEIFDHHRTQEILFKTDTECNRIHKSYLVDDFYGQICHFTELLMNHKTESDVMSLSASLNCARILDQIKEGYTKYEDSDLEILYKQEEILQFDSFDSQTALDLGKCLIELAKEYDREIAVQIVREADEAVIFQYMMDSKSARNLEIMARKRKTALASQHASAVSAIELRKTGKRPPYLTEEMAAAAGAFPIRVNQKWVATLLVSGLHEGKDHELIIRSLSRYLQVSCPDFVKALV